jgi:hypothetical protein
MEKMISGQNGRPVARLVPLEGVPLGRIGVAKGAFEVPDSNAAVNEEVTGLFAGERSM